jgi:hypothetical protein
MIPVGGAIEDRSIFSCVFEILFWFLMVWFYSYGGKKWFES